MLTALFFLVLYVLICGKIDTDLMGWEVATIV